MTQWQSHGDDFDNAWRDAARCQPLLKIDRRHWAWLWLKRNHNYQTAASQVAETTQWMSLRPGQHRLIQTDLSVLFVAGYLFIPVAGVMATGMPGFFGRWDGTRRP